MAVSKVIAGRQGRKGLKVVFTSDKRKLGGGAQCTAQCIDPAPTTTPTPGIVLYEIFQSILLIVLLENLQSIAVHLACGESKIENYFSFHYYHYHNYFQHHYWGPHM